MAKKLVKLRKNRIIEDFGSEWKRFDFLNYKNPEFLMTQFSKYTKLINLTDFRHAEAADFGAGSGRWAELLLPYVDHLHLIEPSGVACEVLKKRFSGKPKVTIHNSLIEDRPIKNSSLDLAISLGVLHHIPKIEDALHGIYASLKPGGVFLGYLYYDLENRSYLYRMMWKISDILRSSISRSPKKVKFLICEVIALVVYFPLANLSRVMSRFGISIENFPLHHYSDLPLYMMRNDALDRFGTTFEKRYSREQIVNLLAESGFVKSSIKFSEIEPFWTFKAEKPL